MTFLVFLIATLLSVFAFTLLNMIRIFSLDSPEDIEPLYRIWDLDDYRHPVVIEILSILMLCYTLFFLSPVLILWYVHIKNFCANRTTNERLAGPGKYKAKGAAPGRSESEASANTGSVVSNSSSMIAVELVNEMGRPVDYADRRCERLHNIFDMCCRESAAD